MLQPGQEKLVDLMVAATGLSREVVLARWFPNGVFRSTINCGFAERAAKRER